MAVKGYWIICTSSYAVNGVEIPAGRMKYHSSIIHVSNSDWRRATKEEIDTMQRHNGNYFNLRAFK